MPHTPKPCEPQDLVQLSGWFGVQAEVFHGEELKVNLTGTPASVASARLELEQILQYYAQAGSASG